MDLFWQSSVSVFNMLSRLVITFLTRSTCLLISWLQSPSAVILEPQKVKSDTISTVSPSISHEVMGPDCMIFVFWIPWSLFSLLTSGDQRNGASASASVLPMNIQGWFLLGLTGLMSLLPKQLSRVFSNTTVRRHQLFNAKCFLLSSSHICMWLLEKP